MGYDDSGVQAQISQNNQQIAQNQEQIQANTSIIMSQQEQMMAIAEGVKNLSLATRDQYEHIGNLYKQTDELDPTDNWSGGAG